MATSAKISVGDVVRTDKGDKLMVVTEVHKSLLKGVPVDLATCNWKVGDKNKTEVFFISDLEAV